MHTPRWVRSLGIAAGAAVLLAVLLSGSYVVYRLAYPGRAFDAAAWNDFEKIIDGVRLKMADRIVARRMLEGRSRDEVLRLLGEPSSTATDDPNTISYWLGPERGFLSIDSEWLAVRFDAEGKVVETFLWRD